MRTIRGVLRRVRQPEYTGTNRCYPCAAVNLALTAALAAIAALFEPLLGVAVLVVGVVAIWLRGYLVPGTPTVTRRYFPDHVLGWFGKAPATPDEGTDVQGHLLEAGALAERDGELTLTQEFRREWENRMAEVYEDPDPAAANVLDMPDATVEPRDKSWVITDGEYPVADWPSRPALVADLAAAPLLAERDPDWPTDDREAQGRLLYGLRVFLESCPACGAEPVLGEETVESCCSSQHVYTYECPGCGERLLELEQ